MVDQRLERGCRRRRTARRASPRARPRPRWPHRRRGTTGTQSAASTSSARLGTVVTSASTRAPGSSIPHPPTRRRCRAGAIDTTWTSRPTLCREQAAVRRHAGRVVAHVVGEVGRVVRRDDARSRALLVAVATGSPASIRPCRSTAPRPRARASGRRTPTAPGGRGSRRRSPCVPPWHTSADDAVRPSGAPVGRAAGIPTAPGAAPRVDPTSPW